MKRRLFFSYISPMVVALVLSVGSAALAQRDLIEGAKKEGEVVVWTFTAWHQDPTVLKPFKEKYPFVKVKVWEDLTFRISAKMIEEAKVGRFTPDVLIMPIRGMVLLNDAGLLRDHDWPSNIHKRWSYQPKHRKWINHAVSVKVPTYNYRVIRESEAPKSWDDLINPKWRGTSVISASGGIVPLLFAHLWREREGELNWGKTFDFWSRVVKTTKPKVTRGFVGNNELHATGEYGLFLLNVHTFLQFVKKGATIRPVRVGKTIASRYGVAVPKTVRHPNAAKLFIDYFLSPEGLLRYANTELVAVLDPEVAKKSKGNLALKKAGIEWFTLPMGTRTPENVRKATRWWSNNLGVARGRRRK